jgi:type II secretory pathway pseudopilin PulG
MIVLAIAAVILLVVLLAVRQLQRNQRDTQRKSYANRLLAAIQDFYGNNQRNPNPANAAEISRFIANYAPTDNDPSTGKPYSIVSLTPSLGSNTLHYRNINAPHSDIPPLGVVYVQTGHWCNRPGVSGADNDSDPIAGTHVTPSFYVVWIGVEAGSYYCTDNYTE